MTADAAHRPAPTSGSAPRLQGKVALVTGGAGGLGRATADTFARHGALVVLADIDNDTGRRAVGEIRAAGGAAGWCRLDVTDEPQWATAVGGVLGDHGRLDILVNCAGISGTFDPDLTSTEYFDRLMRVNARSVFLGMKHAVPAMARTGGGSIVNFSSISASIGQPGVHLGYGASKAAIRSMTTSGAVHHAAAGIRINAVAPGMLPAMKTSRGSADPAWRARAVDAIPMKREGRAQEVADVVLFLASDESSYVTGTEIMVDGGLTAV